MIFNVTCIQCGADVIYDSGIDEKGNPTPLHSDATLYWKEEFVKNGKPGKFVEAYCSCRCGTIKYEIDNGREIPNL